MCFEYNHTWPLHEDRTVSEHIGVEKRGRDGIVVSSYQLPIGFLTSEAVGPSVRGFMFCITMPLSSLPQTYHTTHKLVTRHRRMLFF